MGVRIGAAADRALTPNKGAEFFELLEVVTFNTDLFGQVGKSWDGFEPLSESDFQCLLASTAPNEAQALLSKIQNESGLWGIWGMCDPRTSRLLPFWTHVFAQAKLPIQPVLVISDPRAVVPRLKQRYQWHPERAVVLWLDHVLSTLSSFDLDQVLLIDDEALEQPVAQCLPRLADDLAKALDIALDDQALREWFNQAKDLANPAQMSLRSQSDAIAEQAPDELSQLAIEIYETLRKLKENGTPLSELRQAGLVEQWQQAFARCRPLLNQMDCLIGQTINLKRTLHWARVERTLLSQTIRQQETRLEQQLERMLGLQSDLAEQQRQAQAYLECIEDQKQQIEAQHEQMLRLQLQLTEQSQQLQVKSELIHLITNSHSWKLTASLRWFRRIVRRWRGS